MWSWWEALYNFQGTVWGTTDKNIQNSAVQTFESLFEFLFLYLKYSKTPIIGKVTEWTVPKGGIANEQQQQETFWSF